MTESVFSAYSRYYDLLYRDKDYAAEVEYIDRLLQRHGATGSELLEFGSGTGKHGRLLAQRGYQVVGIERSADMVAQAKQVDGFQCQVGDIATGQLGVLTHPDQVLQDTAADRYVFDHTFGGQSLRFPRSLLRLPRRIAAFI